MKTKKLTAKNAAPVQREITATAARDGNAIAPTLLYNATGDRRFIEPPQFNPFAGDDAE